MPVLRALDTDRDFALSPWEIGNASTALRGLDTSREGKVTAGSLNRVRILADHSEARSLAVESCSLASLRVILITVESEAVINQFRPSLSVAISVMPPRESFLRRVAAASRAR